MSATAAPSHSLHSTSTLDEQLHYWITQSSQLSDHLIESQLRRNEAEAEVGRLRQVEQQFQTMKEELKNMSDSRANALVEQARLREYAESLRLLTVQQDNELAQLRAFNASLESSNAALSTQLLAAQSSGVTLQTAHHLQTQYQTKLSSLEASLAEAQKQSVEHQKLQMNYQILHTKYTTLKKTNGGAVLQALQTENSQYRQHIESVRHEVNHIKHEHERVYQQLVETKEAYQVMSRENVELKAGKTKRTHSHRIERARIMQVCESLRKEHRLLKEDFEMLLEDEKRNLQTLGKEMLLSVTRHEMRSRQQHRMTDKAMFLENRTHTQAQEQLMQLLQASQMPDRTTSNSHGRIDSILSHRSPLPSPPPASAPIPFNGANSLPLPTSPIAQKAAAAAIDFDVATYLRHHSKHPNSATPAVTAPSSQPISHLAAFTQSSSQPRASPSSSSHVASNGVAAVTASLHDFNPSRSRSHPPHDSHDLDPLDLEATFARSVQPPQPFSSPAPTTATAARPSPAHAHAYPHQQQSSGVNDSNRSQPGMMEQPTPAATIQRFSPSRSGSNAKRLAEVEAALQALERGRIAPR